MSPLYVTCLCSELGTTSVRSLMNNERIVGQMRSPYRQGPTEVSLWLTRCIKEEAVEEWGEKDKVEEGGGGRGGGEVEKILRRRLKRNRSNDFITKQKN